MTDLPEPEYPAGSEGMLGENCYTATQMREYRNAALEEAIEHFNLSSETWEGWEVAAFLKGLVK